MPLYHFDSCCILVCQADSIWAHLALFMAFPRFSMLFHAFPSLEMSRILGAVVSQKTSRQYIVLCPLDFFDLLSPHSLCCLWLARRRLFHLLLRKEKEKVNTKTRRRRLDSVPSGKWWRHIRMQKITDPHHYRMVLHSLLWNWEVSTQRYP